jgi:hypothetical protein
MLTPDFSQAVGKSSQKRYLCTIALNLDVAWVSTNLLSYCQNTALAEPAEEGTYRGILARAT